MHSSLPLSRCKYVLSSVPPCYRFCACSASSPPACVHAGLEDVQFPAAFQITLPALGASKCLEPCTNCTLPAAHGPDAAYVFVNEACTAAVRRGMPAVAPAGATLANTWQAVLRYSDFQGTYVQLVNALTGQCLAEDLDVSMAGGGAGRVLVEGFQWLPGWFGAWQGGSRQRGS